MQDKIALVRGRPLLRRCQHLTGRHQRGQGCALHEKFDVLPIGS